MIITFYLQGTSSNTSTLEREAVENNEAEIVGDDADMNMEKPMTVIVIRSLFSMSVYFQAEEKEDILSKSPYFRVEVSILCGRELIAMDRGGTSDPYVMIMQGEEQLHKTVEKKKTVNPVWNDQSNVYIENPFTPLTFQVECFSFSPISYSYLLSSTQVYDKDMVGSDDFMGQAEFDLTTCELHKSQEITLHLGDADDEDLIRF